jgi:phosphohistidine swiveling domain-containing protein
MYRMSWHRAASFFSAVLLAWSAMPAMADVVVTIVHANTATALIDLPSAADPQYSATVTIRFDAAMNLSADSLGLTATIVEPGTFTGLPAKVSLDPNFPVVVSVEPQTAIFRNGLDEGEEGDGNLSFVDSYELEIHSDEHLSCSSSSSNFRLFKAPHDSDTFADITDALYRGSVRARGRGGAFSRFVIVHDTRSFALPILPVLGLLDLPVALVGKILAVVDAILAAGISDTGLVTDLVNFILGPTGVVVNLVLLNVNGAIHSVDALLADVAGHSGTDIPNFWSASSPTTDGAGQIISAGNTLNFTLGLLNRTATCTVPP